MSRNCIVIITTSVGQNGASTRATETEERQGFVRAIQRFFSVEFLSRIDELIIFVSVYLCVCEIAHLAHISTASLGPRHDGVHRAG